VNRRRGNVRACEGFFDTRGSSMAPLAAITAVRAGDGGGRADVPDQCTNSEDGEKSSHRDNLPSSAPDKERTKAATGFARPLTWGSLGIRRCAAAKSP
jgi:hypothetical protein